ncbi:MAG: lamin tail domain-containing protein, partial [Bacteroidota bacterium]
MLDFYAKMFTIPSKRDPLYARKRELTLSYRWKFYLSCIYLPLTMLGTALAEPILPFNCSGPTITQQPQSVSIVEGSPASFTVVANGIGTLSYQWQLKTNGASSFFDISVTSETLSFSSPGLPSDGNQYRVIITDDNGTPGDPSDDCEVTSDAATLNVRLPIAITEFMNNSLGADREFVELRNYGTSSVELAGWTLSDEDGDDVTLPSYTLAPDGIILVVLSRFGESVADAKADFEREWFGGAPQENILVVAAFVLGNSGDEIILKDGNGDISWSLAYGDDETEGRATFLTSTDYLNIPNVYGSKSSPGVNRSGNDLGLMNFLGYESNDNTTDPDAITSADGNVGSPQGEATARQAFVAITEFMNNSLGADREFVELRNYG